MLLKISSIPIVLFALQINQSLAGLRQCNTIASLEVCVGNRNLEVQVSPDDLTCEVGEVFKPPVRDDYTYIPGLGYYKFQIQAKLWNAARMTCMEEGAHLAVINSKKEEQALRDLFKQNVANLEHAKNTYEAFVGVHDYFQERYWTTVLGQSLRSSGYVNWVKKCSRWSNQPNIDPKQNCAAVTHECEGLVNTHCEFPLAFICEMPDVCA